MNAHGCFHPRNAVSDEQRRIALHDATDRIYNVVSSNASVARVLLARQL